VVTLLLVGSAVIGVVSGRGYPTYAASARALTLGSRPGAISAFVVRPRLAVYDDAGDGACANLSSPFQNLLGYNLNGASIANVAALAGSSLTLDNLNWAFISGQATLLGADIKNVNLNQGTLSGLESLIDIKLRMISLNQAVISLLTPTPVPGTVLGGLNLDEYCIIGPDQTFPWYCVGSGGQLASINLQSACNYEYGVGTKAFVQDPTNAYTWVCMVSTSTQFSETYNGTTYLSLNGSTSPSLIVVGADGSFSLELAESGLLTTGGAMFILIAPDGGSVDYGTGNSGFISAQLGALATGGVG
jgi:hypothetical protein